MHARLRFIPLLLLVAGPLSAADPTPAEVFEKRIAPIFKSPNPSSCVQCHLSGVDLKDYILPDADKTFRSLRDQGLIDLTAPEKSKIVKLIEMGGESKGPAVHEKNRKAERQAFLDWIKACAADPKLKDTPKLDAKEQAKPAKPDEVIRHARKDQLLASFEANVWAWRFRCMNCHTEGTPQNDKLKKEHGDRVAWVKKDGAAATLEYLIASKLIDTADPVKSLLLTKPLGEDKHGGGVKFAVGDDAYKGFRGWIEDVAAIRGGKYTSAKDLPPADTGSLKFGTDLWFKLTDTPPAWGDKLLQVRVFAWDEKAKAWEAEPVAVSDRVVWGKGKLWQHTVTLLAAKGSDRAKTWARDPALPEGKYLVKVYVDADGKLAKDWKATLGDGEYAGQAEFRGKWKPGYGAMTEVNAGSVKK